MKNIFPKQLFSEYSLTHLIQKHILHRFDLSFISLYLQNRKEQKWQYYAFNENLLQISISYRFYLDKGLLQKF